MVGVKENDIKVDLLSLFRLVDWDASSECHEFFFGLWNGAELPVFEFAESVLDDLMGVIAFEIVKNNWECTTCKV